MYARARTIHAFLPDTTRARYQPRAPFFFDEKPAFFVCRPKLSESFLYISGHKTFITMSQPSFFELVLQDPMLYAYWAAAIVATVVFVIQTIMLFVGFDTDSDFSGGDASFDADGLQLLSVKTVACFVLGFGWTGVIFYPHIEHPLLLAGVALLVGLGFMVGIAFLLKQVLRLSQDNTFHLKQSVGSVGEVYLRIPPAGCGKITVSIEGSMHELHAVSSHLEELPTGSKVRIVEAIDDDTVRVEML